jgi:hypothetical protein
MIDRIGERLGGDRRPCTLVVDPDIDRLSIVAQVASARGWERIGVGAELSAALLDKSPGLRPREADRRLVDRVAQAAPGPVVCTEIDLLFAPALDLDPLRLFARASRFAHVVVAWPGSYDGEVLAYAVPEHGHYRMWTRPDVGIVRLA